MSQHMSSPVLFSMIYCIIFRSMLFYDEVLLHKSEKKLLKRSFREDNLNKFNESLTLTDWLKLPNMNPTVFINEYSRHLISYFQ